MSKSREGKVRGRRFGRRFGRMFGRMGDRIRGSRPGPRAVAALALATAVSTSAAALGDTVLFVDDDAAPAGDGATWQTAYRWLQDALEHAAEVEDERVEIRVAQGVHRPDEGESQTTGDRQASFATQSGLALRGGYAGLGAPDPDARDPRKYVTVLSGDLEEDDGPGFTNVDDNSFHVVSVAAANESTIVDGFLIERGNADGTAPDDRGAGVRVTADDARFVDCRLFANVASIGGGLHAAGAVVTLERVVFDRNAATLGGGAFTDDASIVVTECRFDRNEALFGGGLSVQGGSVALVATTWDANRAEFNGGGLHATGGAPVVEGGVFESNFAAFEGGGLYAVAAAPRATGVTFRANIGGAGGGGRVVGGAAAFTDCRFEDNYADEGAGLHLDADAALTGCVFADNAAETGAGLSVAGGAPVIDACTFSFNVATEAGGLFVGAASPTLLACRFEGNRATRFGGGMVIVGGDATVRECLFTGNVVEGGFVSNGGAMHLDDSASSVTRTWFTGNAGKFGAGVSIARGAPEFVECHFLENAASLGGAAYVTSSAPRFVDCTVARNTARGGALSLGGGLYAAGGATRLERCTIEGNEAGQDGGGAYLAGEAAAVAACVIVGNVADGPGGGLAVEGGAPLVSACTINGNVASAGGGIANNGGSPTVVNCVLSGNLSTGLLDDGDCASPGFGGAVSSIGGAPLLVNSTLSGNRVECGGNGGGVGWTGGTLTNTILWGNEDAGGADESGQIFGAGTVVDYCCVQGWTGGLGGAGNIGADPLLVDADGPDDEPGTADDDVRLAAGSPAIDAADNDAVPAGTTTDRAGRPRFVDDPETKDTGHGAPPVVDMGAHEFAAACTGDVDGNGAVDFEDLLRVLDAWGPCEGCAEDLNDDGAVGFDDLLVILDDWGDCE